MELCFSTSAVACPDVETLDRARAKFEYLLKHYSKENHLDLWTAATSSLANVFSGIARATGSIEALRKAVQTYQAAIEVIAPEEVSHWALVRENLGGVFGVLGRRTGNPEYFAEGESLVRSALAVLPKDTMPHQWVGAQETLARILFDGGQRLTDRFRLEEAIRICESLLQDLSIIRNPHSERLALELLERCRAALVQCR